MYIYIDDFFVFDLKIRMIFDMQCHKNNNDKINRLPNKGFSLPESLVWSFFKEKYVGFF